MWPEGLRKIKDGLISKAQPRIQQSLDLQLQKAAALSGDERQAAYSTLLDQAELLISTFPQIEHYLQNLAGLSHLELSEVVPALNHHKRAIDLHPWKSAESDYSTYVINYLTALKAVGWMQSSDKEAILLGEIDTMEGLMDRLPDLAYNLHDHIGYAYRMTYQSRKALPHQEAAVMLHPNPTEESDFAQYHANYLEAVRKTTQGSINHLQGKRSEASIAALTEVVNSTGNVVRRFPTLQDVYQEHHTAFNWITHTLGPKQVRIAGIDLMQPPMSLN